ncbi:MAG: hypothetical protein LBD22_06910 [Spirochaetaceae bacterium]|jgi:hypothetical protein|nr:hypothetical protein [Spirochaetaceae bacterium]
MQKKLLRYAGLAILCVLGLGSCANPIHSSSGKTISLGTLSFSEMVEGRGYMSGSVLWNADEAAALTHLRPGIFVGVRLSNVENPEVPAQYGTIRVESCDKDSITFTYQPYSAVGGIPLPWETWTLKTYTDSIDELQDAMPEYKADLNHDGVADMAWTPPDQFRPGIRTDSRYLKFVTKQTAPVIETGAVKTTHTTMFSVLESQYSQSQYPGGLTGINPSGAWIYSLRQMENGFHMHSGEGLNSNIVLDTVLEVARPPAQSSVMRGIVQSNGVVVGQEGTTWQVVERPAGSLQAARPTTVTSLVKGDYIIDNLTGDYYYYKGEPNPEQVNPTQEVSWTKLNRPVPDAGNNGGSSESGNESTINSALEGIADFTAEDIPYFVDADADDTEFVAFKTALISIFTNDYNPNTVGVISAETSALPAVIAFLNAAIADGNFRSSLNQATLNVDNDAGSLNDTGNPDSSYVSYRKFVYRNILRSALAVSGMHRYVLEAQANPAELSTAIPAASLVIRNTASSVGDSARTVDANEASLSVERKITGVAPQYQNYLDKKSSARSEFEKEFKLIVEKDLVKTLKDIIFNKIEYGGGNIIPQNKRTKFYESLNNMKTLVALGLSGGGQHHNGKVEISVGAAVFLQMEIDTDVSVTLPKLLGAGLEIYKYDSVYAAGPVVIQVQLPIKFNIDLTVEVIEDRSLFAGYTGFYGGKVTGGINYSVNYKRICIWPWPKKYMSIPWGLNVDSYESHSKYNQTIAYAGFKNTFDDKFTITLKTVIKPYITITPSFGAYGIIWAKVPAETGLPITVTAKENFSQFNVHGDLNFNVGLALGVGIKILCFDFYKGLYDKILYDLTIALFDWNI